MTMSDKHAFYMGMALAEAKKSAGDIPVGAIVLKDGVVISCAHNLREKNNDISAHAEVLALKKASSVLKNWRLGGCEMYVTLEPCPMCAWAILNSRIPYVYFGSYDLKYGALGSKINLSQISDSKIKVFGGIMEKECSELLGEYFKGLRL